METIQRGALCGGYVAMVTPFRESEDRVTTPINYSMLEKVIDGIAGDVSTRGIVVCGCTGSSFVLSDDEVVSVAKYTNKYASKKWPDLQVIVGDGRSSTAATIDLVRRVEQEARVLTHLIISPYGVKPSDVGIYLHYTRIAKNIKGNIVLYSVPSRTGGNGIDPVVVGALAKIPNIIGIKESASVDNMVGIIKELKSKPFSVFSVLCGDDALISKAYDAGAVGHVSVVGNLFSRNIGEKLLTDLIINSEEFRREFCVPDSCENKTRAAFGSLYGALFPKSSEGNENPSPNPSTIHYAMTKLGIDVGIPRLPLTECRWDEKKTIDKALDEIGRVK